MLKLIEVAENNLHKLKESKCNLYKKLVFFKRCLWSMLSAMGTMNLVLNYN
jgi:hypothetical protein